MATYHFQAKVIQASRGRSVVAAAAYRAAAALYDDQLGRTQNYLDKPGVVHSEILLPAGAPERWRDRERLWNEVTRFERRRDAVLAREIEIALPRELPPAEAVALAREFVREQFVARGMVADLNVHWGVASDGEAQPHAHVLLTMRGVQGDGFGLKRREWNDRALLREWRERWAGLANQRLAEAGHEVRIDHRSHAERGIGLEPQHKIGPAGARRAVRDEDAERAAEHRQIARRNGERILAEPTLALEALTQGQSTFTRRDLARLVHRHTDGAAQFAAVLAAVEACPELVRLGRDGRGQERLSTREMLATERQLEVTALALSRRQTHAVGLGRRQAAMASAVLGEEQALAFGHATRARDLAVVVGYAGTGKSTMLGVARAAWEAEGYRVRGAALSGIAAEGLQGGSGIDSRTLASLELAWDRGQERLGAGDVLVVDEAGLIGSRQMQRLLARVEAAGAKLVLVGDAEQLQAIEAGAAFRLIAERVGVAEITAVRRQREGWQQQATRELATGRTAAALERYQAAGAVREHATLEKAKAALLAGWDTERRARPADGRIMLAHTRADVRELNERARALREDAGETYWGVTMPTENGERRFSVGDEVLFGRNDRGLGVKNGTRGKVDFISGIHGDHVLEILVPEAGGEDRLVKVRLAEYAHLDHGYAATVHKTQGVTVDRAHVLATAGMDRHMAYVALSRHREGVALHWSVDELGDRDGLLRTLGRERLKDTSLDYGNGAGEAATASEAGSDPGVNAFAERRELHPLVPNSRIVLRAGQAAARRVVSLTTLARRRVEQEALRDGLRPLLGLLREQARLLDRLAERVKRPPALAQAPDAVAPASTSPAELRGPGALSLALGVLAERWAQSPKREPLLAGKPIEPVSQERIDCLVDSWLQNDRAGTARRIVSLLPTAYRDPATAQEQLDQLRQQGDTHALSVLAAQGPEALGRLRGTTGLFASARSRDERSAAEIAVGQIVDTITDLERMRVRDEATSRTTLEQQERMRCTEVPGLSGWAVLAIGRLRAAGADQPASGHETPGYGHDAGDGARRQRVAFALVDIEKDRALADELARFRRAAGDRLGGGRTDLSDPQARHAYDLWWTLERAHHLQGEYLMHHQAEAIASRIKRLAVDEKNRTVPRAEPERRTAPDPQPAPSPRPFRDPSPGPSMG